MSDKNINYLILLKDAQEATEWLGSDIEQVCVIINDTGASQAKKSIYNGDQQLDSLRLDTTPAIVIAYLEGDLDEEYHNTGKGSPLQTALKNKISNFSDWRIFHHGGGLNPGASYQDVERKFEKAGFISAGFPRDHVAYFSKNRSWQWNEHMDECKSDVKKEDCDVNKACKALAKAWGLAAEEFGF